MARRLPAAAAAPAWMDDFEINGAIALTLERMGLPPRPLEWIHSNGGRPDIGTVMNRVGARELAGGFVLFFNAHSRNRRLAPVLALLAYTLATAFRLNGLTSVEISTIDSNLVYGVSTRVVIWIQALTQTFRRLAIPGIAVSQTFIAYTALALKHLDAFNEKEERRIMEFYMVPDLAGIAMLYRSVARRKPRSKKPKKTPRKPSRPAGKLSVRV